MKKCLLLLSLIGSAYCHAQMKTVNLTFLHTSDVHGSVFTYNYTRHQATESGLPIIYSVADSLRRELGERLILTDGGDCLQGQPTAYYSNFIDTISPHLIAQVMNQMGYACAVMGNHDIEAGHPVYDRWVRELNMPVLGANVIDTRTHKPYLTPYIIIERAGIRIALLGMVTPAIPFWLPEQFWSHMRFEDITESSRKWIATIQQTEKPDLIVGVFHSGFNGGIDREGTRENATEYTAKHVPGFDFILYGHDHQPAVHAVQNSDGKEVLCLGTKNAGENFVLANVQLQYEGGRLVDKKVTGEVPKSSIYHQRFMSQHALPENTKAQLFEYDFIAQKNKLDKWVNQPIGMLSEELDERDAYFGPSRFIDLIHQLQLQLSGADISIAAPLSFASVVKAGTLTVNDMFNLYKFENYLYTMRLTGYEVKGLLEMSYGLWVNQMKSAQDHLLLIEPQNDQSKRWRFKNYSFNFDSAAGIYYTVDVTQPVGKRITILHMADGTPFDPNKIYKVAINSYRGNGGGELLTEGAGIPREELSSRIITSTTTDLRYNMIQYIQKTHVLNPKPLGQWKFIPEDWVNEAKKRDSQLLFSNP